MRWQDKGYLLSLNKYNENSAIAEFYTENNGKLSDEITNRLNRASAVCQLVAYLSLVGLGMMWYNISNYVGIFFLLSTIVAILFIRIAMAPIESEKKQT